jgi:hypothetical protein
MECDARLPKYDRVGGPPAAWRINYPDGSSGFALTERAADEDIRRAVAAGAPAGATKTPLYEAPAVTILARVRSGEG